jgi:hypothetical protein
VPRLEDLLLLLFCHVLETFYYSVAFWLPAEAGEGETHVPLSADVIETKRSTLCDLHRSHHAGVVLLDDDVVVAAFMVEVLPS